MQAEVVVRSRYWFCEEKSDRIRLIAADYTLSVGVAEEMSGVGPKTANTYGNVAVPSNYVAGVGRGAMGFTTRSDIGPARPAVAAADPQVYFYR